MLMSALMRPGRAVKTMTRVPRKIASSMSWVTKSAVLRARRQIACSSSCRSSRVSKSRAPKARPSAGLWSSANSARAQRALPCRRSAGGEKNRRSDWVNEIEIFRGLGKGSASACPSSRAARDVSIAVSQGNNDRSWNIMPRTGPGRPIGRPSSVKLPYVAGWKSSRM